MRLGLITHLLVCIMVVCIGLFIFSAEAEGDWNTFGGSLERSGYYNGSLPADNATMWKFNSELLWPGAPVVSEGILYAGGYDYHVYAIDVRNGELIWKTPLDWAIIFSTPHIDEDHNQLYIMALNSVYALNLTTGDVEWTFRNGGNFMESGWPEVSSPVAYGDYVYFGSVDGALYKIPAVDPDGDGVISNSEVEWSYMSGNYVGGSHVDGTEGIFYAPITYLPRTGNPSLVFGATAMEGGTGNSFYAIDDSDGSLYWRYEFNTYTPVINISMPGTGSHSGSGPSYDLMAGHVYAINGDRLFALMIDPGNTGGDVVWEKSADNWIFGQSPTWYNGTVYIGDDNGVLHAFDATTGDKDWEETLDGPIRTSPLIDADGYLYTSTNDVFGTARAANVTCMDLDTRIRVWDISVDGWTLGSFAVDDGVLFIGTTANTAENITVNSMWAIGPNDMTVDLEVTKITANNLFQGSPGSVIASVYNDGTMSAYDFEVAFYDGKPSSGEYLGTVTVPRARPGTATPVLFEWTPTDDGDFDIYAVADNSTIIDETDEDNNEGDSEVSVLRGKEAPTCEIDEITPSDATRGGSTTIEFKGDVDDDGDIMEYEWYSSRDGFLSGSDEFDKSANSLSPGTHIIYFRVKDDDGLWSKNATTQIVVRPKADDDWTEWMHDNNNTGISTSGSVLTPEIPWQRAQDPVDEIGTLGSPVVVDGVMYYCSLEATLALDAQDGSVIWIQKDYATAQYSTPLVDTENGYVVAIGDNLTVLDIDDGSVVWHRAYNFFEFASPSLHDGNLYVHSLGNANLTSIDIATNTTNWNFEVEQDYLFSSPSIGFGNVYVASRNTPDDNDDFYALYAIDVDTGDLNWRWKLGGQEIVGIGVPFTGGAWPICSPTVYEVGGQGYVAVGDTAGTMYGMDPAGEDPPDLIDDDGTLDNQDDGEELWSVDLDGPIVSTASFHDDMLFVATWMGTVYCLDATTGGTLWDTAIGMPFWGSPVINGETVYIGGLDSYLYGLDIDDGSIVMKYLTRPLTYIYSTPALYQDSLYFTGGAGPWFLWVDDVYQFGPFADVPELEILESSITLGKETPVEDDMIDILVNIRNQGTADTEARLYLYEEEEDFENMIGYGTVMVPAGGYSGMSFTWNTTDRFGENELIARVWSPFDPLDDNDMAKRTVFVVKPGEKPFAKIRLIDPNPVEVDDDLDILFSGTGHAYGGVDTYLWNISGNFLSSEKEFTKASTDFDPGSHTITFTVQDSAGLWADEVEEELIVITPGELPVAIIDSVDPNPAYTDDTISFEGHGEPSGDAEIDEYEWRIDGAIVSTDETFELDADELSVGAHIVKFKVKDDMGRTSKETSESKTTLHILDEGTKPEVDITDPKDNDDVSGIVTIEGTADAGDDDITKVEVAIGDPNDPPEFGANSLNVTGLDSWSAEWDTSGYSGDVAIHARSWSGDSPSDVETIEVEVVLGPKPTVTITSHSEDDDVSDDVTLSGTADDSDGEVDKVEIKIGSAGWDEADGTTSWSYEWDSTIYSDGEMMVKARSHDGTQYSSIAQLTLNIANNVNMQPIVIITSPENNSGPFAEDLEVEVTTSDSDGAVELIELSINDDNFSNPIEYFGGGVYTFNVNTELYAKGDYTLYVRAQDDMGAYSTVAYVYVEFDNTVPEAVIDSIDPPMARQYKHTVVFEGHGEDGDIVEYEWSSDVDGFLNENESFALKAEDLTPGRHNIEFKVKASNGLWSEEVSFLLHVLKKEKDDDDGGGIPGFDPVFVAISLAGVALIIGVRRRR